MKAAGRIVRDVVRPYLSMRASRLDSDPVRKCWDLNVSTYLWDWFVTGPESKLQNRAELFTASLAEEFERLRQSR